MKRRAIFRPRYVPVTDARSPMRRLLEDNINVVTGDAQPDYEAQWRTIFKAQRLGFLDADRRLTDAGREFLANASNK